jgi:hypothetical protein
MKLKIHKNSKFLNIIINNIKDNLEVYLTVKYIFLRERKRIIFINEYLNYIVKFRDELHKIFIKYNKDYDEN